MNAVTDPITEPTIRFWVTDFTIEGGGLVHGTFMSITALTMTVDDGGTLRSDGEGYTWSHGTDSSQSIHGKISFIY